MNRPDYRSRLLYTILFGTAMGYFEAAIVVYLRALYYPAGFTFPLVDIGTNMILVELGREMFSLLMLASVAALAARRFWERFGYFVIMFGVWDIWYYIWLKIILGWPETFLDWDILFLIPLPWIGPVLAPVLISVLMMVVGVLITRLHARGGIFAPTRTAWAGAVLGSAVILYSFMRDLDAGLRQAHPEPYGWWMLAVGLACYVVGFYDAWRHSESV